MMMKSTTKIQKLKITDNKIVLTQGPTDDCGVFVFKFIDHLFQGRPIAEVVQEIMQTYNSEKV